MGEDLQGMLYKIIWLTKSYNNDPKVVDQRVKSIIVTKLEEAELWATRLEIQKTTEQIKEV